MLYARIDNKGKIIGLLDSKISKITDNCIAIDKETHIKITKGVYNYYNNSTKEFSYNDFLSDEEKKERKKNSQIIKIKRIFAEFAFQLKKIAIGKDGTREYINAQLEAYETMYRNAIDALYSEEKNQAIIAANRAGRAKVANALVVMNELRGLLIDKIEAGEDVSKYIEFLQGIEITEESITDERIDAFLESFDNL